jgi:hypothetical protein
MPKELKEECGKLTQKSSPTTFILIKFEGKIYQIAK